MIREFVDDWIVKIEDLSPTVAKIRSFLKSGHDQHAKKLLPTECVYPVETSIAQRIHMADRVSR